MSHSRLPVLYVPFLLVCLAACSPGSRPKAAQPPQAGGAAPAAQPGPADPAAGAGAGRTVTGPVLETMNASNYTYVRVKTEAGEVWAASSQFEVAVGDQVVVPLETPMTNFHSPSLNRDFPLIYFASRIEREGGAAPPRGATPPPMAIAHASPAAAGQASPGAGTQASQGGTAAIAPRDGETPIAKVWADRKALAGKTVTVRGKVVKFNGGILGRNWIHLQDGSGKAADGTNDLLVTTDGTAKVGDVIAARGVVAVDQDFTSGYAYKVLIEKASITPGR